MQTEIALPLLSHVHARFSRIYDTMTAERCAERFAMLLGRYGVGSEIRPPASSLSSADIGLIAYADMVSPAGSSPDRGSSPLKSLSAFLEGDANELFSFVHLLPFYPSSSDDGFSVMDFRAVSPEVGNWRDVNAFCSHRGVMFDLVLNHASRQGRWFIDFQNSISPAREYFYTVDGDPDVTLVVRPRTHPLLTQIITAAGPRQVWTTFSEDQVDLNYRSADLLFEILDILLFYIAQGARLIRLDAVAFLWKEVGTSCIHLPQTHEIVKLLRDLIDLVAPGVRLVTETNVPHRENLSYLGAGDEAHLVYQFSLAPLLAHALLRENASTLKRWLGTLDALPEGTSVLNFTASHDGIGIRPASELLPEREIEFLIHHTQSRGGFVSYRSSAQGQQPYELNCTYFDMLGTRDSQTEDEEQLRRFLCSQALMLALQGVPLVYFNSLFGLPNDHETYSRTGRARSLNRHKWTDEELVSTLGTDSQRRRIFREMHNLIKIRRRIAAFSPSASQHLLNTSDALIAFTRGESDEMVLCVFNLSSKPCPWPTLDISLDNFKDLLSARKCESLSPFEFRWLARF